MTQTIYLSELLAIAVFMTAPYFGVGAILLTILFRFRLRLSWRAIGMRLLTAYPLMYLVSLAGWALAARFPVLQFSRDVFLPGLVGMLVAALLVTISARRQLSPPPSSPAK